MRSGTGQAERAMGEAGGPCVPLWSGTSILHALPPTLSQSAPVLTGPHWPKTGGGFQASGMGRGLGLGTSHRISSSLQALGPMAVSYPPPQPPCSTFPTRLSSDGLGHPAHPRGIGLPQGLQSAWMPAGGPQTLSWHLACLGQGGGGGATRGGSGRPGAPCVC